MAVFYVGATVDSQGRLVVRKQLRRTEVLLYFAKLEPCVVGMEAYGSLYYWGRELAKLGHTVRLIAPQFVRLCRDRPKG